MTSLYNFFIIILSFLSEGLNSKLKTSLTNAFFLEYTLQSNVNLSIECM